MPERETELTLDGLIDVLCDYRQTLPGTAPIALSRDGEARAMVAGLVSARYLLPSPELVAMADPYRPLEALRWVPVCHAAPLGLAGATEPGARVGLVLFAVPQEVSHGQALSHEAAQRRGRAAPGAPATAAHAAAGAAGRAGAVVVGGCRPGAAVGDDGCQRRGATGPAPGIDMEEGEMSETTPSGPAIAGLYDDLLSALACAEGVHRALVKRLAPESRERYHHGQAVAQCQREIDFWRRVAAPHRTEGKDHE